MRLTLKWLKRPRDIDARFRGSFRLQLDLWLVGWLVGRLAVARIRSLLKEVISLRRIRNQSANISEGSNNV
jgi:hypothetical protein